MGRQKIAELYSASALEIERPQPLSDRKIEKLIEDILFKKVEHDITDQIYEDFKIEMINWLTSSTLNRLIGLDKFNRIDICNGCTQFIDSIYMKTTPQILLGDYRYHERLNTDLQYSKPGELLENVPLLIVEAPAFDSIEILNGSNNHSPLKPFVALASTRTPFVPSK